MDLGAFYSFIEGNVFFKSFQNTSVRMISAAKLQKMIKCSISVYMFALIKWEAIYTSHHLVKLFRRNGCLKKSKGQV